MPMPARMAGGRVVLLCRLWSLTFNCPDQGGMMLAIV